MREFLNMGGYAFYVWTSYGIAAVVLVLNILIPLRQHRRLLVRIARRARRRSAQQ
jgi:heme exporter protein D